MPQTLRLNDGSYMRRHDVHHLLHYLYATQCVEVIGFSNVGKSALFKLLAQTDVWKQELGQASQQFLPIYIDCNRMLNVSGQGFYELILRCLQECCEPLAASSELIAAYNALIAPSSEFQVPLSFNKGLTLALQISQRKLILLLDEFDEPFARIDSRVFLNLRALQDRHAGQLVYATATGKPLVQLRTENHCTEFCELFGHRQWYLAPLVREDVNRQVRNYMEAYEAHFTSEDFDFIYEWSGGHPRMLEGICRILDAELHTAQPELSESVKRWQLHSEVAKRLRSDDYLTQECSKIWAECSEADRQELLAINLADHRANPDVLATLSQRHLLLPFGNRRRVFARLLWEYIQRQNAPARPASARLWVDINSGEVQINGQAVETLTGLEYKLMLFFFQNADKIIDKYQIVTQVWGESYIDEVDDARIEKLISRLRQKIEPDPANPHFLLTVRGRGYKLALA